MTNDDELSWESASISPISSHLRGQQTVLSCYRYHPPSLPRRFFFSLSFFLSLFFFNPTHLPYPLMSLPATVTHRDRGTRLHLLRLASIARDKSQRVSIPGHWTKDAPFPTLAGRVKYRYMNLGLLSSSRLDYCRLHKAPRNVRMDLHVTSRAFVCTGGAHYQTTQLTHTHTDVHTHPRTRAPHIGPGSLGLPVITFITVPFVHGLSDGMHVETATAHQTRPSRACQLRAPKKKRRRPPLPPMALPPPPNQSPVSRFLPPSQPIASLPARPPRRLQSSSHALNCSLPWFVR